MPKPLRNIALMLMLCLLWGCGEDRAMQSVLDRAEALMETRPDSALALLRPYDGKPIKAEEQRARFALLYSMALDKNGIDTTDFKVLQPALDYYPAHGTDADKLRTLYYAGCIYQNDQRMSDAMEAWAEALQYRGPLTDSLTLARLLVNQGNEYYRLYQFQKFVDNNRQAEEIYHALGRKNLADKAFLYQFELSLNRNRKFAMQNIEKVAMLARDSVSPNAKLARSLALLYEIHFGNPQSIGECIDRYRGMPIDSLDLTQALLNLGRIIEAEKVFQSARPGSDTRIKYLLRKVRIEKAKGNYEEALASSEQLLKTFDQEQSTIIEEGRQFAEERFEWSSTVEKHKRAERKAKIFGLIAFFALILAVSIFIYRIRVNRLREEQRIASLMAEQNRLKEVLNKISSPELRDAISRRLLMLNPLTSDNEKRCTGDELKKLLGERAQFMRDSRLALTVSHPNFIAKLISYGLDDEELDYVSLYAIGMSGKEVGEYLKKASHYHLSSRVRSKLGFGKSGPVLRVLIKEMMEKSGDF